MHRMNSADFEWAYENTVGHPKGRGLALFSRLLVRLPGIIFVTDEMVEILPAEDARIVGRELDSYGVVATGSSSIIPTCRRPGTVCFWSGTGLGLPRKDFRPAEAPQAVRKGYRRRK